MNTINRYYPQSVSPVGDTLLEKLEEMGLNINSFAQMIATPEDVLQGVVQGSLPITAELATALERGTLIPAHFWLQRHQLSKQTLHSEKHRHRVAAAL